jgi:eukaryotic-like serine/threonine-protein kinase
MIPCPDCGHPISDDEPRCAHCYAATVAAPASSGPGPGAWGPPSAGAPAPTVPFSPHEARLAAGLLPTGTIFDGKYRIERQIGAGGMSVVYLATEVTVDSPVVIKALLPQLSRDDGLRERLLREARAMAKIDHPNVVRLRSAVIERGELFIVMEYVEGEDLSDLVKRWAKGGGADVAAVMALFAQVLDGVEAAHDEGIVHRDIKPSNVLLRARDGRVKVTDFGIAKVAEQAAREQRLTAGLLGTLWYMAPEQLKADPGIDMRADIYALGVLLFEMLTGAVPFDGPSDYEIARKHLHEPLPAIARFRGALSPAASLGAEDAAALDAAIAGACAKEREGRFATCDAFRRALEPFFPAPAGRSLVPSGRHAGSLPPSRPRAQAQGGGARAGGAEVPRGNTAPSAGPTSSAGPARGERGGEPTTGSPGKPDDPASPGPGSRLLLPGLALAALGAVALAASSLFGGGRAGATLGATTAAATTAAAAVTATSRGTATAKGTPSAASTPPAATTARGPATAAPTAATAASTAPGRACKAAGDCASTSMPAGAIAACRAGLCAFDCPAGRFDCGTACLDLRSDVRHCGACGGPGSDCTREPLPAGATASCADGRCGFSCPAGRARCGGACCQAGEACEGGACEAP